MTNLAAQLALALSLSAVAIFIFRRVAHDYRTRGSLSLRSTLLEFLMFGLHSGASYLYLDSSLSHVKTSSPLFVVATVFLVGGLLLVLLAMSRLGWEETIGKRPAGLRQAGLYSYTRNPQIVAYAFVVVGYSLLWPSWSGVIWVAIYAVIAHVMVRTEEEHLTRAFGEEFRRYCERTPRYIGIPKARWAGK